MTGRLQSRHVDLALVIVAAPLWAVAILLLGSGTGWGSTSGHIIVFCILIAWTLVLFRLMKRLAIAAILAPFCAVIPILVVAWMSWLVAGG